LAGLFEGDDADLLTTGTDEADGAQADLVVDANFVFDSVSPPAADRSTAKAPGI